jgi:hypothetical protein
VRKRVRTDGGQYVGRSHTNPLFDTREYECVLDDGSIERYTANIIAETYIHNVTLRVDCSVCWMQSLITVVTILRYR